MTHPFPGSVNAIEDQEKLGPAPVCRDENTAIVAFEPHGAHKQRVDPLAGRQFEKIPGQMFIPTVREQARVTADWSN